MLRSTSIVLATASLLVAAPRSHAQSPACGAPTVLTLAAGVGQNDRVDATASPLQFRGRGVELSASFAHSRGAVCIAADADGGTKLLSTREGSSATERLAEADAGIAALRATSHHSLALGAELRGQIAVTDHAYDDPRHDVATYRVAAIAVGPALRWRRRIGRGDAIVQASSPLLALIDHPYMAVWTTDPEPSFRLASLARYRGVHASFSYAWTTWHGVASVASYRLNGARYDDVHPLRALSQSLTIGALVPIRP